MTPEEFWTILYDTPDPIPVIRRLYYNDDGSPICYSMEELPYKYIELTAEQYSKSPPNVRVVNETIIEIKPPIVYKKLSPSDTGITCAPEDVCVIINHEPNIKWSIITHES